LHLIYWHSLTQKAGHIIYLNITIQRTSPNYMRTHIIILIDNYTRKRFPKKNSIGKNYASQKSFDHSKFRKSRLNLIYEEGFWFNKSLNYRGNIFELKIVEIHIYLIDWILIIYRSYILNKYIKLKKYSININFNIWNSGTENYDNW
jgi:hypothetical protein